MNRKKIAILLPDLRGGGVERMRINLARYFLSRDYCVDFVLMKAQGELLSKVPEESNVIELRAKRIRNAFCPLVHYLRDCRPDALLVGMWSITIAGILAYLFARISGRVVVSDHNNLSSTPLANTWLKRLITGVSIRIFYPLASERIAVSKGVADDLSSLSGLSRDKFKVIYNPVFVDTKSLVSEFNPWEGFNGKKILSVGTLKAQKDHETLIRAFAHLKNKLDAHLVILGEGKLRSALEQLIESLGLTKSVYLPGFASDPKPWYRGADLFVLSSRWEGFGNVIVEALEAGTPVVSTDCPSGPNEILEDGHYGHLVPVGDAEALAEAILHALQEEPDREALRERARDFSVDKIGQQYLNVLFPKVDDDVE